MRAWHLFLAAFVALWTQMRWELDWGSLGIGVALLGVLEGSLRVRWLAWIAWIVGTAFSALVGGVAGGALAIAIHPSRATILGAALPGFVGGGTLAVTMYRRHRRRQISEP